MGEEKWLESLSQLHLLELTRIANLNRKALLKKGKDFAIRSDSPTVTVILGSYDSAGDRQKCNNDQCEFTMSYDT